MVQDLDEVKTMDDAWLVEDEPKPGRGDADGQRKSYGKVCHNVVPFG